MSKEFVKTLLVGCMTLMIVFGMGVVSDQTIQAKDRMVINVLNATVKDEPVQGAKIVFEKNGIRINAGTTDRNGRLVIEEQIFGGADDSSVKIIISKEGYATLEARGPFNGLTFALSKNMKELDGYRIVLSWGEEPADLDSHLRYEGNHIYYEEKQGRRANLDVDDTNSFGPETITIEKTLMDTKYIYAVHDYSNKAEEFSTKLSNSNAKVSVYIGSTQIETFYVPQGKVGNLWVLFTIDGYDDLEVINQFTTTDSVAETKHLLGAILDDPEVLKKRIVQDAYRLNVKGEENYHAGNLEEAVRYYQKAILVREDYAQAYSNLGLAYQKQGKLAEAIWANRKAISIAKAQGGSVTLASSFYNIARIFESRGEWEDALQNFEWALQYKQHSAYTDGIARMKEKLGR